MTQRAWAIGIGVLAIAATAAGGGVSDVKVTTDRSIDCSSMETIARDLYRDCKTDQEKAVATWYFVRRLHFHWPTIPTWDSIDLINSYGFALCGYQSTMYCQIATAGGLKARTMHPPRHVIAEAFYDGAWHMFDCQVGWYALNRKGKVASCAEMKKDPTLVTDAIKENRASQPYFQCRDNVTSGSNYAKGARTGRTPGLLKRKLVINLRGGESITRKWSNEGKSWHKAGEKKWLKPAHGCTAQAIDANDPVNWPLWKPYAQVRRKAGERVIYGVKRTFGNGRMVYEPKLTGGAWAKDASVTFVINSPYVAVDAWLDGTFLRATEKDELTISARGKGGWKKIWTAPNTGEMKLEKVSLKEAAWFGHKYQVKIEMKGAAAGDVGVRKLKFTTVFMNNIQSLPYLLPGKNVVRVAAAGAADLKANPLTLEYVWAEAGKDKTLKKTIEKLPFETTVEVGGKEPPRMKSLTLSVAP